MSLNSGPVSLDAKGHKSQTLHHHIPLRVIACRASFEPRPMMKAFSQPLTLKSFASLALACQQWPDCLQSKGSRPRISPAACEV